jgi:hypothetical protein
VDTFTGLSSIGSPQIDAHTTRYTLWGDSSLFLSKSL